MIVGQPAKTDDGPGENQGAPAGGLAQERRVPRGPSNPLVPINGSVATPRQVTDSFLVHIHKRL